jgi:hypothetical protein
MVVPALKMQGSMARRKGFLAANLHMSVAEAPLCTSQDGILI